MTGFVRRLFGGISARFASAERVLPFGRLSMSGLVEFTRSIRFFLSSGMTLRDAMRSLSENGSRPVRRVAAQLVAELDAGWSMPDAVKRQGAKFPALFQAMVSVGDETGNLPEVMADLERYYGLQKQLQQQFRSQIFVPLMQFVLATLVVAGLIYVLGMLPQTRTPPQGLDPNDPQALEKLKAAMEAPALDPVGLGVVGEKGAMLFLAYVYGGLAVLILVFLLVRLLLKRRAIVDRVLLMFPFIGTCIEAFALARLCFALKLMFNTNLSILDTVRLAFQSSDNMAYIAATPKTVAQLRRGNSLVSGLTVARVFPRPFLNAVAIGEESGHLSEVMEQQAEYYDDLAKRRLAVLTRLLATLVWLGVAAFVVTMIFRLFTSTYLKAYDKFT